VAGLAGRFSGRQGIGAVDGSRAGLGGSVRAARQAGRGVHGYSRLSALEAIGVTLRESVSALMDPYLRGDSVAAVAETTGQVAVSHMYRKMRQDATGRRILKEKPRLNLEQVDWKRLEALPPNTLGKCLADYFSMHGFEPGDRPPIRFIADEELAYVMMRYRETHDLLHILCGFPVSVTGEVALKYFEMVQTGLPMTSLAAIFGTLRAEGASKNSVADPDSFFQESQLSSYIDWSVQAANKSGFFMNFYFEECWEEDITDFRKRMGLPVLPEYLPSLDASWDESRVKVLLDHYQSALNELGDDDTKRRAPFEHYLASKLKKSTP